MKTLKIFLFATVVLLISCSDKTIVVTEDVKPTLPTQPYNYHDLELPTGTNPARPFASNEFENGIPKITPWGATLGRVLFYDKKLSLNNTVSCGTCHHQDKGFADGLRFSTGFEGRVTTRNSMAITNPIVQNNLFWDSRSKNIQDLSLQPVQNHIEMGMENLNNLVEKIEKTDYYAELFQKAYGSNEVTPEKISSALSQFVGSITTNRSKLDLGLTNDFSNFTDLEMLGKNIFHSEAAKCSGCHGGNNFSALDGPNDPYGGGFFSNEDLRGATNIGLDLVYADNGLGNGKFKIPSLRNIELTAPYMHDGRFNTLEEVIDHYSEGIKPHKHLDVKFKDINGNVKPLNLSTIEKKALVAFLKTLTDKDMAYNPRWSDPFKQ